MRLVVDTGVFSASLNRRRSRLEPHVSRMAGNQIFLAAATVGELRYGALVAQWRSPRHLQLQHSIRATTIVPFTDALLTTVAALRYACRLVGHALHDRSHANDLWIAASAIHIGTPLLTDDRVFRNTPGLQLAS